jgi:hypothetical protein
MEVATTPSGASIRAKTTGIKSEQAQIEGDLVAADHMRYELAHDARKLESVTRAGADQEHTGMFRVPIEKEMFVGRVGIKTNLTGPQFSLRGGDERLQYFSHGRDLLRGDFAPNLVRPGEYSLVMRGNFHSVTQVWEPIKERARLMLADVNRTSVWLKPFRRFAWLEPVHDLALDA